MYVYVLYTIRYSNLSTISIYLSIFLYIYAHIVNLKLLYINHIVYTPTDPQQPLRSTHGRSMVADNTEIFFGGPGDSEMHPLTGARNLAIRWVML